MLSISKGQEPNTKHMWLKALFLSMIYFAVQIPNSCQTLTTKADLATTKSDTELLHVPARLACRVTCI